ncbi:flagellar hook-length control protein FliK [Sedimentitalea sp. JM2-8]|uniref:Flagellar hook-length control protein FliK n=1 Tax=Sedimentitalea xiamensis TaxID=3050037 RepID=A0ABT7F937_9RHOB|nr:flagellar hook-length control protein FliK [Sedimentitalea xiamensis]MDK3071614.1 flagellar hook-length control protein FliK [Sedimentitalea xiamensis]
MLNNSTQLQTAILPKKPKPGAEPFDHVPQNSPVGRNGFAAMFASLAERSEAPDTQVPSTVESPEDVALNRGESEDTEIETGRNDSREDAALRPKPAEEDLGSEIAPDHAELPQDTEFFQESSPGERREARSGQSQSDPGTMIGVTSDSRAQRDPVRGSGGPPAAETGVAAHPGATALSGPSGSGETSETISPSSSGAGPMIAEQTGSTGNAASEWITGARKQDGSLNQPSHGLPPNAASIPADGQEFLDKNSMRQSGGSGAETNLSTLEIGRQLLAPNMPAGSSRSGEARLEIPTGSLEPTASETNGNKPSADPKGTIKLATVPDAIAAPFAKDATALFSEMSSEPSANGGKDPANVLPSRLEPGLTSFSISGLDHGTIRADSVRNAAAQAVEVIVRQAGKPVEISLNPEELGRVRMALTTTETGVTVVITSERPETLDLMRRHIDQLAQEFLRLGYENTAFEFGSDSGNDNPASGDLPNAPESERDFPNGDKTLLSATPRLVSTGLDLRL